MSFYINYRKQDEPALEAILRKLTNNQLGIEEMFETDFTEDDDGSVNAVSDHMTSSHLDVPAFYKAILAANLPIYGAFDDYEAGYTLFALADGTEADVEALGSSDYPAVRVNPDGTIERECVAEAVRYWAVFKAAYFAVHGVEAEVA